MTGCHGCAVVACVRFENSDSEANGAAMSVCVSMEIGGSKTFDLYSHSQVWKLRWLTPVSAGMHEVSGWVRPVAWDGYFCGGGCRGIWLRILRASMDCFAKLASPVTLLPHTAQ